MRQLIPVTVCALVVWIAAGASAEPIKLSCQLNTGRSVAITLDLELGALKFGKSSAQIVQQDEKWIVAQSSSIKSYPPYGLSASSGSFVFDRLTGQFWRSEFSYFAASQIADIENPIVFALEGTCTPGF